MHFEREIQLLDNMRYMRNEGDDIFAFGDALNTLAYNAGLDSIKYLFDLLEGDCDEPSAMDDVTETIFYIVRRHGEKEGLKEISNCFIRGRDKGRFWLEVIVCKIINSHELFELWKPMLNEMDDGNRCLIMDILSEIVKENKGKRSDRANEILGRLNQTMSY